MFFYQGKKKKKADGLKLALNKTALRLHTKMKTTEAVRLTKLKLTHAHIQQSNPFQV